jgi:ADP-heptose:LPS heptosyltransferase
MKEKTEYSQRSIVIYRTGSLGDTIVALPALKLIARSFPAYSRVVLTNFSVSAKAAAMAEILDGTGLVDDYIEYPLFLRSLRQLLALRQRIRATRATILVYITGPRGRFRAIRDALFFYLCGIQTIIGLPLSRESQVPQLVSAGRYEYVGSRLLRCLSSLGPEDINAPNAFDLKLSQQEIAAANEILLPLAHRRIVVASIGAKADVKDWGHQNWIELLSQLAGRLPGWGLVLIGAGVEHDRSETLAALWPGRALNLCGALSVRVSAGVLAAGSIYIGHDSGPMHLAAAVGTPCVSIFSSQNLPGEWFPYGRGHQVIYHEIKCQGCRLNECKVFEKACIGSITVAEVLKAVENIAVNIGNPEYTSVT